jgi:Carbohydrate-selective porin, OprB family/S-layer homology domain
VQASRLRGQDARTTAKNLFNLFLTSVRRKGKIVSRASRGSRFEWISRYFYKLPKRVTRKRYLAQTQNVEHAFMDGKTLWNLLLTASSLLNITCGMPTVAIAIPVSDSDTPITTPPTASDDSEIPILVEPFIEQGDAIPITAVSQFADVQLSDWAFQALQTLVAQYGCLAGYPDGTYQGNRALSRNEFAAALNACLDEIQVQFGADLATIATQEHLTVLQRLMSEFETELAGFQDQVDEIEWRMDLLQVTPGVTSQLRGEATFAISDVWGDEDPSSGNEPGNNTVFQSRFSLALDTSFTGEDRLRTTLKFGNFERFNLPDETSEGRLGFDSNTDGQIELDDVSYEFPVGDRLNLLILAQGGNLSTFPTSINPFSSGGQGAISRFGQRNPIYRGSRFSNGSGVGATVELIDDVSLEMGYLAATGNNPSADSGFFNGGYGIVGQLTYASDALDIALSYAHSYVPEGGNDTGTGSTTAIVEVDYPGTNDARPVVVNSYGLELNYRVSEALEIGGWVGFSDIRAIGLGDAEVWNYALRLGFPDLGGEGNLAGILVGMEPRLTGTTPALGLALGKRRDADVGLHIEGFYRIQINDYLSITPGIIWLTAPNHDRNNDDVLIGTIRTTFRF